MADFLGKGDGGGLGDCKEQQPLWDRRPLHRYGRETRSVECGGDYGEGMSIWCNWRAVGSLLLKCTTSGQK